MPDLTPLERDLLEALKDIQSQAQTRIVDGDEMGPRVWRIGLVDVLAEANRIIAKAKEQNP